MDFSVFLLKVSEWYKEGIIGGGFYELNVKLLTEDGQVHMFNPFLASGIFLSLLAVSFFPC